MILNKNIVKARFDAASHSYDQVAHIQRQSAQRLVTKLYEFSPEFSPKTVLDLGAGTGYVTEALLANYPESLYTINDIAPAMIAIVKNKFDKGSKFNFFLSDMEDGEFYDHDLIISNLALQWVNDLQTTIHKFYSQSKILAFSCLLEGTFQEWQNILKSFGLPSGFKSYPTEQSLIELLSSFKPLNYNFDVRDYQMKFPNARTFLQYLQNLGVSASHIQMPIKLMKNLIRNHDQEFVVTYKIFFAIIKRL